MKIKTVSTVMTTDALGRPMESRPVREVSGPVLNEIGQMVDPWPVEEAPDGYPVRFVDTPTVLNAAGQRVAATPVKGGGAPFARTAAILGAGGLDYAMWDSGLASSLSQDAPGTIPASIGAPVGRWNVRQKPPHFASQAINASRPVLQADGLKFDGSDDNLLTDWVAQAGANCIIAQVIMPVSTPGIQFIAGSRGPAGDSRFFIGVNTDGTLGGGVGANSTTTIKGQADRRGQSVVVALSCDGSMVTLFDDSAGGFQTVQSGVVGTTYPMRIGTFAESASPASNFFGGSIKRLAFGKVPLTLEQFQAIRAEWLAAA